jgi:adenosylcobinamide-GDP ribazoletransferase
MLLPPLHAGLASRFRAGLRGWHLALWSAAGAIAIGFAPALAIVVVAVPLWGWWLKLRIGGISGDGHGAGIELLESTLLAALVLVR